MRSTGPREDSPILARFRLGWARACLRKGRPFGEASATIISGVALAEEKEVANKNRSRCDGQSPYTKAGFVVGFWSPPLTQSLWLAPLTTINLAS